LKCGNGGIDSLERCCGLWGRRGGCDHLTACVRRYFETPFPQILNTDDTIHIELKKGDLDETPKPNQTIA